MESEAKKAATIYPRNEATRDVAEISILDGYVEVKSPKNKIIITTVKNAGYRWNNEKFRWRLKLTATRGRGDDRVAEIGNNLLNAGVPICIFDESVRNNAISGTFEPQKYQWVLKSDDNENEFEIFWRSREHSLYDEAKKLPHARYHEGTIRVPSRYFAEIREFVELYGLGISEEAEELLKKEEALYKDRIVISPEKVVHSTRKGEKLKEILESSRDVLEDLMDED